MAGGEASYRDRIVKATEETLASQPEGLRFVDLVNILAETLKGVPKGTIGTQVSTYVPTKSKVVYKPGRGLYRHVKFREGATASPAPAKSTVKESSFYQPFADWLVNESEDCTIAQPLGGKKFGDRWGTPDVIGVWRPRESDIYKPSMEIISAEIKTDADGLITAFGQACAYKIFSHKSYIVVPRSSAEEDMDRIDSLAVIFGLGLVVFDNANPDQPDFMARVRPRKDSPDVFWVNQKMQLIKDDLNL